MHTCRRLAVVLMVMLGNASVSHAQQTILFDTDPFAGSTAPNTPGRQIVGGELFTTFNPITDVFAFDAGVYAAYGIADLDFSNGIISTIPSTGFNAIVLQTFEPTPFAAGTAANLIAGRITTSGAGFFLYFNSGLDVARLVFSANLSDDTADLKVLARLTNLSGQSGKDAFASFTAANFQLASTTVPEPSSILMVATGLLVLGLCWRMRQRRPRLSIGSWKPSSGEPSPAHALICSVRKATRSIAHVGA